MAPLAPFYEFSAYELHFLLSLNGPIVVSGIENPYRGLLAEEIEPLQQRAWESLLGRGILRQQDDRVFVAQDVSILMGILSRPQRFIQIVCQSADGGREEIRFLQDGQAVVQHHVDRRGHVFVTGFSASDVLDIVRDAFGAFDAEDARPQSRFLPADRLSHALDAQGRARWTQTAREFGMDDRQATALAEALQNPRSTVTLSVITPSSAGQPVAPRGVMLVRADNNSWLVRPCPDGQRVELIPANAKALSDQLSVALL